jgi:hypothetical protein
MLSGFLKKLKLTVENDVLKYHQKGNKQDLFESFKNNLSEIEKYCSTWVMSHYKKSLVESTNLVPPPNADIIIRVLEKIAKQAQNEIAQKLNKVMATTYADLVDDIKKWYIDRLSHSFELDATESEPLVLDEPYPLLLDDEPVLSYDDNKKNTTQQPANPKPVPKPEAEIKIDNNKKDAGSLFSVPHDDDLSLNLGDDSGVFELEPYGLSPDDDSVPHDDELILNLGEIELEDSTGMVEPPDFNLLDDFVESNPDGTVGLSYASDYLGMTPEELMAEMKANNRITAELRGTNGSTNPK